MVKKRSYRARRPRRTVPKKTQRIRRLAGQRPVTMIEHLAGYGRGLGSVAKAVSTIAGLVNAEAKELDTSVTGTGISNSGSYSQSITNIAEGDDRNQRNGRFVLAKHLQVKFQFVFDPTVQSTFSYALIMDKKPAIGFTATPWTDVFVNVNPNSLINRDNADRFVILKRGMMGASSGTNLIQSRNVFIPLKGIHIKWNGSASTAYEKNAIFLLAVSNQATNTVSLHAEIRFEYYDN